MNFITSTTTNQNMVISDALFCSPTNLYFTARKLIKWRGNGAKVGALLDSMRASSPTRRANSNATDQTGGPWKLQHPSALSMFDEEISAAFKGKEIVIFLDYDGTLSPIVEDPDHAVMSDEMRQVVKDIAKFFPTAIVSGRCRAKVYGFVKLSELYYAGSHGMDIKGPSRGHRHRKGKRTVLCQPAREFLPVIDEVCKALTGKIKHIPGAKVENNEFCLSVHYRCVPEERWGELSDQVRTVMKDYPQLKLTQGRKVLEVRPTIKWDKGNAVEFLLESLGYAADSNDVLPIYIGDDRTDEDAFKVLRNRGKGLGILVSKIPKETNASYTLQEPSEVMHFLKRVVEWKKKKCNN